MCSFFQKAYIQIYYPELVFQSPRMLHVPLDVQVLFLIAWGSYICLKKKTHHHHLLYKIPLQT